MSDFAQPGLICTLQRLNESHIPQLSEELLRLTAERPIALILPCHARDLGQPALKHICEELRASHWLGQVVVSMNGLDAAGANQASRFFAEQLSQPHTLLWNDGPVLSELYAEMLKCERAKLPHGKGLNMWAAIGWLCADGAAVLCATQDCDVASFSVGGFARLCYACALPDLGFGFAKMYYPRVTDRLYGRASRLFLAPLLQALVRLTGHHPLLDFLQSFRYPLAGEMTFTMEIGGALPISPRWGLEIGMLCEVFRRVDPRNVCQVDGGRHYDHRHQSVEGGLDGMCSEIAQTLLAELAAEGVAIQTNSMETLTSTYRREAGQALQRSEALARMNGLPFHAEDEAGIVARFCTALQGTGDAPPTERLLPWKHILAGNHDAATRLLTASVYTGKDKKNYAAFQPMRLPEGDVTP